MAFVSEKPYWCIISHVSRDLFTTYIDAITLEEIFGINFFSELGQSKVYYIIFLTFMLSLKDFCTMSKTVPRLQ